MPKDHPTSEIIELKKKLEENPESLAFAPLADAYRKDGDLEEALAVCKKGLEKHPSYTSGRVVLGRVLHEKGKEDEAVAEFRKVLDLDPDNLMAHSLLGSILLEKHDYQAAIEEYQKVLTLNPDDEQVQESLKQAIEKAAGDKGSKGGAKREPVAAPEKKQQSKESTASLTIAELYLKQGHFDKAVEVYQELLADDPQNLMLRQKLSETIERQQRESSVDPQAAKVKKSDFTKPPDQKEDVITEDPKADKKQATKLKKEDDSKFTSEDILQVMRRGGKDDVVVEEKKPKPASVPTPPSPSQEAPRPSAVDPSASVKLDDRQMGELKGAMADLSAVSGILRCFLLAEDGNPVLSMGETGNNSDLGKQSLAIFRSTRKSVSQLEQGKLQQILVTAEDGHILLVSFSNFVLIVLASAKINLGLLRLSLDSATKKIDKIL